MNFTLNIWRQKNALATGNFVKYQVSEISKETSFFEMLDQLNDQLIRKGEEPVAFDNDCREGICGTCCIVINGRPHGHERGGTVCQLHMRSFRDGQTITIEPLRAAPFPLIRDLMVDRSAFDKIIAAGGYIGVSAGSAADANAILINKDDADEAMDSAQCLGCGACVASCKNASAMLFVSAKIAHLSSLPQGKIESSKRVRAMVRAMDEAGFGNCSNDGECYGNCPKEIKLVNIWKMNRQFICASLFGK